MKYQVRQYVCEVALTFGMAYANTGWDDIDSKPFTAVIWRIVEGGMAGRTFRGCLEEGRPISG